MEVPQSTVHLVERARAGDDEAYNELFTHAAERLLLFIRMRLGTNLRGKMDSMDVLQETYTEALRHFARFEYRGDDAFARWLCRIAENQIRAWADHHGARKRRPPAALEPASRALEQARASATGPITAAARREQQSRLEAAMVALPDDEREALLLRHFQAFTLDEIARRLERSPTAVRRLLGRAHAKLGRLLEAEAPAGEA